MTEFNEDAPLLLSDILKCVQKCPEFDDLLKQESLENDLEQFDKELKEYDDIDKFGLISNEINGYLHSLLEIFEDIEYVVTQDKYSLSWISEAKTEVLQTSRNIEVIDIVISNILVLLESRMSQEIDGDESTEVKFDDLLEKFNSICELSLKVKKFTVFYKKRIDVFIQYSELDQLVMGSINSEIEECRTELTNLKQLKSSSHERNSPTFDLETILSKMKSHMNSSNMHNLRLPTFNGVDEMLYNKFCQLRDRINPLEASMMFIPQTIEQFSALARTVYPKTVTQLIEGYQSLENKLKQFSNELDELKIEIVDQRWEEIFSYLINESLFLIENLENQFQREMKITDKGKGNYKLDTLSNTLSIVRSAINEGLLKNTEIIDKQKTIHQRFVELQDSISNKSKDNNESQQEDTQSEEVLLSTDTSFSEEDELEDYQFEPLKLGSKNRNAQKTELTKNDSSSKVRSNAGKRLVSALQMKPVYLEYNFASARKNPELNYHIFEDTLKKDQKTNTNINNKLLNKLMEEIANDENELDENIDTSNIKSSSASSTSTTDDLCINMKQLKLKDQTTTPVRRSNVVSNSPLSEEDPFITPKLRATLAENKNSSLLFAASERNVVMESPQFVSTRNNTPNKSQPTTPNNNSYVMGERSQILLSATRPTQLPVPIRTISRTSTRQTIISPPSNAKLTVTKRSVSQQKVTHHNHYSQQSNVSLPPPRPLSRLEQIGAGIQTKLGTSTTPLPLFDSTNKKLSFRSNSSLGVHSRKELPMPTPMTQMKEIARSQSSLGSRISRPMTVIRQRRDFSNPYH